MMIVEAIELKRI